MHIKRSTPRKHQGGAADTMECLSMQETLCLGGKGALKEFAEGHPTSSWTEPVRPHQDEGESRRELGEGEGEGEEMKDKDEKDWTVSWKGDLWRKRGRKGKRGGSNKVPRPSPCAFAQLLLARLMKVKDHTHTHRDTHACCLFMWTAHCSVGTGFNSQYDLHWDGLHEKCNNFPERKTTGQISFALHNNAGRGNQ